MTTLGKMWQTLGNLLLMLRSQLTQAVRFQRLELLKGGSQRRHVQLGLESKVIGGRLDPQQLELDKGKQRAKQMVGLCHRRLGRRLGKCQVAFERLVILFDLPPCLVQSRDLPKVKCRITGDYPHLR